MAKYVSGGTMERPASKQLLAEVSSGKADIIVVYKVDRLTRALSDFAKIVEGLDDKGASSVSVTQAFNTALDRPLATALSIEHVPHTAHNDTL